MKTMGRGYEVKTVASALIVPASLLSCYVAYPDVLLYDDQGNSAIVQEEGDTLYVHHPDGNTNVIFKQDDGLVYNDEGSAIVERDGNNLYVGKPDGSTDVLYVQDE